MVGHEVQSGWSSALEPLAEQGGSGGSALACLAKKALRPKFIPQARVWGGEVKILGGCELFETSLYAISRGDQAIDWLASRQLGGTVARIPSMPAVSPHEFQGNKRTRGTPLCVILRTDGKASDSSAETDRGQLNQIIVEARKDAVDV